MEAMEFNLTLLCR